MAAKTVNGATNRYKMLHELSIEQLAAIDLLVTGQTDEEVAQAVNVHRTTVTRWRLYHARFQAALNQRRHDVFGAAADRLRALLPTALAVLEKELSNSNNASRGQLALSVIKASGLTAADIGPPDPEAVIEKAVLDRSNNQEAIKWGVVLPHERDALLKEWERCLDEGDEGGSR